MKPIDLSGPVRFFSLRCLFFFALSLLVFLPAMGPVPEVSAGPVYTIGVVPQFEARRLRQIWQPILNQVEKQTGEKFELVGSPTIPTFEAEFLDGEFDFAYMNPYHLVIAFRQVGYRPLVRDVGRKLFGVLVASKTGNIEKISDLAGKIIAFPAPNALGASLQMRQELTDNFGLDFSARYVKTHDSVYLNVLLGEASAGGGVAKTLNQQKEKIRNSLKVIHKTVPVAPHPFAVHPRVSKEVADKVKKAFLNLGTTPSGREMLSKIPIKQIGEARMADYAPLEKMGLERFYVKQN